MSTRNLVWVAIVIAIATMLWRLPPMAAKQDSVYRTYSPLVEVDALVRQRFVEPVQDDRLVDGAIRGMMRKLDPYSGYIAPEEMSAFERRTSGSFIGVGLEIGMHHGQLTVIAPVEGGPAMQAGVRAGDVIVAIDDRPTEDLSVVDADELVMGSPGTSMSLCVRRASPRGGHELLTFEITRGPVTIGSVKGFRRQPDGSWSYLIDAERRIGYVRVSSFNETTSGAFDRALADLAAEIQTAVAARAAERPDVEALRLAGSAAPHDRTPDTLGDSNARRAPSPDGAACQALILDLRFNPGGLLPQAVELVDRFIASGVIVSTVTRRQAIERYSAHPEGTLPDIPLVVLVNGASASASEIVAGALQDHGRAVIAGERTFGKGSVQHVIELSDHHAAIRLTVAFYQLPKGRIVHKTPGNARTDAWGVTPDIVVPLDPDEVAEIQASRHSLDGMLLDDDAYPTLATRGLADAADSVVIDRQLRAALSSLEERLTIDSPATVPANAGRSTRPRDE